MRTVKFPWGKTTQNQTPPSARRTEESQELQKAFNTEASYTAKVMKGTCKTATKFDPVASIRTQNLRQGNHHWAVTVNQISVAVTCCWHMARAWRCCITISQCSHITSVSPRWGWTFMFAVRVHTKTTCNATAGSYVPGHFSNSPLNIQVPPCSRSALNSRISLA